MLNKKKKLILGIIALCTVIGIGIFANKSIIESDAGRPGDTGKTIYYWDDVPDNAQSTTGPVLMQFNPSVSSAQLDWYQSHYPDYAVTFYKTMHYNKYLWWSVVPPYDATIDQDDYHLNICSTGILIGNLLMENHLCIWGEIILYK